MVQNMSCKIYMDHAATTEMLPQVRKAMEPYLMEEYGNASTSYEMGRRTREALEGAREQIAMLIKAKPEEIFFTSGGSESDNWVIKNVAAEKKEKGKHVITSKIEHHAVLRSCEYLEKLGYELTYLDVDAYMDSSVLPRSCPLSVLSSSFRKYNPEPCALPYTVQPGVSDKNTWKSHGYYLLRVHKSVSGKPG